MFDLTAAIRANAARPEFSLCGWDFRFYFFVWILSSIIYLQEAFQGFCDSI